ncbi:MAG: hypothetical protein IJJ78_02160 [Paludibacteraceae bacterium]|nr:hypothetical protein [Paludibacteraceae bacterium]MBQ7748371.1 hypothetical protein [Paludibacteraceae bacterium]MBR0497869.1 hypothetical protein [Paludibacteraceae bacterium]
MAEETTKRTIANFNNGVGGKFPLDAEGLTALQNNERLLAAIGALGGDLYILSGCEDKGAAGYVFVKDTDGEYPLGEVLRVEGGQSVDTLCLVTEGVDVTAEQVTYTGAYTTRHLEWGTGTKMYSYSDFKKLDSVATMMETIEALRQRVEEIQPEAIGTIKMWPSATVGPGGKELSDADSKWKLCNGTATPTGKEYTKILDLVGSKLPDMSGQFVVGYSEGHSEYGNIGNTGGVEIVTLTAQQSGLRRHNHRVRCGWKTGSAASDPDGLWFSNMNQNTDYTPNPRYYDILGQDTEPIIEPSGDCDAEQPHENRPPFIVMAYIIKVKD